MAWCRTWAWSASGVKFVPKVLWDERMKEVGARGAYQSVRTKSSSQRDTGNATPGNRKREGMPLGLESIDLILIAARHRIAFLIKDEGQ